MPTIVKLRVFEARDLPIMDSQSQLTDAYVTITFADLPSQKTETAEKTLNPVWNSDHRFMLPEDRLLQDEPIVFNVWDYDQVTAHNIIGKELTSDLKQSKERTFLEMGANFIKGWFPIYDTLRGHCGELRIKASIDFFGDTNPFKDSSAGILFFSATQLPEPFPKVEMLGFVEELVYEDDPEEDWADYMRSKRKSNNQRQHLFTVLSGQVRRHLGRKTMELDGNAVLGYNLEIDFDKYGRKDTTLHPHPNLIHDDRF